MEKKRFSSYTLRDLVYIGVFAAIWALVENSFGTFLHAAKVPEKGTILAAGAILLMTIGRAFVPRAGSTLLIGAVTALLRSLTMGGNVLGGPSIGIFMEAAMAEAGFLTGSFGRGRAMLAGGLAGFWLILHKFLTMGIISGRGFLWVYQETTQQLAKNYGLDPAYALAIFVGYGLFKTVAGVAAGWIGYGLVTAVRAQLGVKEAASR